MKRIILNLALALLVLAPAAAKDKKPEAPKDTVPETVQEGLFTVTKKGADWYMTIPDSILGRPILAVTRYVASPVGAGVYGGEMVNNQTVYWEKGAEGTLNLRSLVLNVAAKDGSEIAKAVKISSENPILGTFKAKRTAAGSKVDVTKFFAGEVLAFSLDEQGKKRFHLGELQKDLSYISSIRTYPINTEVTTTKTFRFKRPEDTRQQGTPNRRSGAILPAGVETGSVSIQLNTSFVLLPEVPMQRRWFDLRVGYFTDSFSWFSDEQQSVQERKFITRWRLEPRPEDVEKMKRGELVEPVKPIVFYIDPATPKQWRPYLIAGVNDWQVAFEQAGFKNAIYAKEWPEDDPTMSMEDARFSVIRYLASDIPNAYGPQVHDPRSGEIIESHIGWYHNVMKLVHDWYMVQVGAIDPRAQKMKFDDELMGDLIRFVSSHEVGHTLGLRHNMGASSQTPVEKLRDKEWVEANGHTVSIMDYARFNYVAQPEDNISYKGIYPRIGIYDKWAIEYGYKPTFVDDEEEDHKIWNKEIIARLSANPRLWFGSEEVRIDPRSQREDLGDNSMKASEYGLLNLRRVVKALPEWTAEEADMNTNLERIYGEVISQYNRYLGHVCENIGGIWRNYKSVEQDGDVYQPVPKDRQLEAMDFLKKNIFTRPDWLMAEDYMYKLTDQPDTYLYKLVDYVLNPKSTAILNPETLDRMRQAAERSSDNYSPEAYLKDLTAAIFTELGSGKAVDSYRRYVQRTFVTNVIGIVSGKESASESKALLLNELMSVYKKAKQTTSSDYATKAHYADIAYQIEKALLR